MAESHPRIRIGIDGAWGNNELSRVVYRHVHWYVDDICTVRWSCRTRSSRNHPHHSYNPCSRTTKIHPGQRCHLYTHYNVVRSCGACNDNCLTWRHRYPIPRRYHLWSNHILGIPLDCLWSDSSKAVCTHYKSCPSHAPCIYRAHQLELSHSRQTDRWHQQDRNYNPRRRGNYRTTPCTSHTGDHRNWAY